MTRRLARSGGVALATLGASLSLAGAPAAQQGTEVPSGRPGGSFGIAPATQKVTARPPVTLSPTKVFNGTGTSFKVHVFPAVLVQDPDGTYQVSPAASDAVRARKILGVSPRRFELGTNQSVDVGLEWRRLLPKKAKGAFLGLVIDGVPASVEGGTRVRIVSRVVGLRFLRLPHYHALGRITQFRAEQGSARTLLFTTRVRNTGKIDGEPLHGMVTVRKAGGRVVASSPYPQPSTVLPGYVRDIPVEIRTVLAPGRYTAESNMTLGRSKRSRKRLSFTLTAPNKLPTRRVRIAGLSARGEEGGAAKLDVTVLNSGSADSPTLFTVRLFKLDHGKAPEEPVTEEKRDGGTTKAGERRKISVEVGHLQAGTYRVLLSVSDGQRRGNTYAADFRPAAKRSLATKTKDFFSDHALVFVLLALLLAFAAAAWAVRSRRALERRLAAPRASQQADTDNAVPAAPPAAALPGALAEPEAPPVPVPTEPAATSDLININTAPADELLKLPGVGRKAAERIVAHREEYGEFGSLDDLGHVEGFDDARVRRLSPGATT